MLPRTALAAKGSENLRKEIFAKGAFSDVTFLLNRGGWVFDDAEHRYSISLTAILRGEGAGTGVVPVRGPYANLDGFVHGIKQASLKLKTKDVESWNDSASLPLLPSENSGEVFLQLRNAPRLDFDDKKSWFARPYRELDATNDKKLMKFSASRPEGCWPVFQGRSFDIWVNDACQYYGWGEPDKIRPILQRKRLNSARSADSPFQGFEPSQLRDERTLSCNAARVAFRDVARATDSRTVHAALLPPQVFITNTAPYLLWPRGDERDEAFLLGILCSLCLDWYARRFVELHLNFHIFSTLPVPRCDRSNPLWKRTVSIAARLACTEKRFREFAHAVGIESGALTQEERDDLIHELDAVVAHLYGLSESQLTHIFETFHEGWNYGDRLKATLKHFRIWQRKRNASSAEAADSASA